ncbi:hypothetical protein O1611_g3346 [Lasiodiplodia mahajangana]|uniref:Uncharacterized protein n=1 Tax=Lasiodiplodia mahajangana TaxID=1108764 RepID=A0ACC2JS25_9PEZI|nr:hypothetical protein O1611_g3346 [Lasiodiplodia mahajangana]
MNDDSDGEDYASQLSPSNGQFPASSSNITPRIPNILIADPTLQQRTEEGDESKARDRDEDKFLISSQTYSTYHSSESSFSFSRLEQATASTSTSTPHHHHQVTYSQSSASRSSPQVSLGRARSQSVYSEAPPAYSPSPISPITSRSNGGQQDQSRNYNTFGISRIMGAPEVENERLLGPQPESMGGPVDEEHGRGAWVRRARKRVPSWLSWKYALLGLVVLIVSVAFLSGISSSSPSRKGDDKDISLPVDKEPEAQVPDESDTPGDSQSPNNPGPPESPSRPNYCEGQLHHYNDQVLSLEFVRSQNLTFKETRYKRSGSTSVRVGGYVNVRRLGKSDGDPRMVLEIATNEPDLRLYTSLDASEQEMKVSVPETYESTVPGQRPCVEMKGTVWVPDDAEISILSLRTIYLNILLFEDLSLRVVDYTDLSSVVGRIKAGASEDDSSDVASYSNPDYTFIPAKDSWAFDSRIVEVHTTSGNIDGNWPLYDMLGLHTTSGTVKVSITPKDELEDSPKSAVLSLSTISGTISATEPVHEITQIPQRDYLVDVRSTSGSIHGLLAFSAGATVHTTASNVALDLLPVINVDKLTPGNPAQLETVTTSGVIAVRVLDPVFFDDNGKALENSNNETLVDMKSRALDCLEATHKSTSGNIGLHYSQSWEGMLYAQAMSGQLVAKGKDLKILKYTGGWPGSKMEARKGDAGKKSTIEVNALLGNVEVTIGDE